MSLTIGTTPTQTVTPTYKVSTPAATPAATPETSGDTAVISLNDPYADADVDAKAIKAYQSANKDKILAQLDAQLAEAAKVGNSQLQLSFQQQRNALAAGEDVVVVQAISDYAVANGLPDLTPEALAQVKAGQVLKLSNSQLEQAVKSYNAKPHEPGTPSDPFVTRPVADPTADAAMQRLEQVSQAYDHAKDDLAKAQERLARDRQELKPAMTDAQWQAYSEKFMAQDPAFAAMQQAEQDLADTLKRNGATYVQEVDRPNTRTHHDMIMKAYGQAANSNGRGANLAAVDFAAATSTPAFIQEHPGFDQDVLADEVLAPAGNGLLKQSLAAHDGDAAKAWEETRQVLDGVMQVTDPSKKSYDVIEGFNKTVGEVAKGGFNNQKLATLMAEIEQGKLGKAGTALGAATLMLAPFQLGDQLDQGEYDQAVGSFFNAGKDALKLSESLGWLATQSTAGSRLSRYVAPGLGAVGGVFSTLDAATRRDWGNAAGNALITAGNVAAFWNPAVGVGLEVVGTAVVLGTEIYKDQAEYQETQTRRDNYLGQLGLDPRDFKRIDRIDELTSPWGLTPQQYQQLRTQGLGDLLDNPDHARVDTLGHAFRRADGTIDGQAAAAFGAYVSKQPGVPDGWAAIAGASDVLGEITRLTGKQVWELSDEQLYQELVAWDTPNSKYSSVRQNVQNGTSYSQGARLLAGYLGYS